jgi:hypothetical protein
MKKIIAFLKRNRDLIELIFLIIGSLSAFYLGFIAYSISRLIT